MNINLELVHSRISLKIETSLLKLAMYHQIPFTVVLFLVQLISLTNANHTQHKPHSTCKSTPDSPSWPSPSAWASLNHTLSGRLFQPVPPGAVCHPNQPSYNPSTCPTIQAEWLMASFHTQDPVSSVQSNWNNDTCLPYASDPCSGKGYPVCIINATCVEDVKAGVDFARRWGVRLIVKGTGHDYLGR